MSNGNINQLDMSSKHRDALSTDDIFSLMDLYFNRRFIMYGHIYNSYNKFINDDIKTFLKENNSTFFEHVDGKIGKYLVKYKFEFDDIAIRPPMMKDGRPMYPSDARNTNQTYSARLEATVTQYQEMVDLYTGELFSRKVVGAPEKNVPIANIPIMVRSQYCTLSQNKQLDNYECDYDPGCYFIVNNGSEKVIISQERMIENKPLVFKKKGSVTVAYYAQVNSVSPKLKSIQQIMRVQLNTNGSITLLVPILKEFPIVLLFRAMGITSDRDIIDYIVQDKQDHIMIDVVQRAIRMATDSNGKIIRERDDAINYLTSQIRVLRKYSEDKDVRQKQKIKHLEALLNNNFLPHITGGNSYKMFYLGYVINKLLKCSLGRQPLDDRDSLVNKRIDLPGPLLDGLFRQFFKKMLNECKKYWSNRNPSDDKPVNIINQIRPNIIEQGLKAALSTGVWSGGKKGVAQVLQRLTYLQAIEFFRRVDSPSNDASSSKLTSPRHLHQTQNGMYCCVVGDTEVLLSDGVTTKKIKDFTNADTVLTINQTDLREEVSQICNFFKKEPESILQITTVTSHVIKCTKDHPILVCAENGNVWKRADQLTSNDSIVIKIGQKMLSNEKQMNVIIPSTDVSEQYKLELLEIGLLDKKLTQQQLEITARLLGACMTDGHLGIRKDSIYYDCEFCVGEEADTFNVLNDIVKLGFGVSSIVQRCTEHQNKKNGKKTIYNTFNVYKNGAFAYYMAYMGGLVGKKTSMHREMPKWILDGNARIKQEFLSGFQGGDGCRLSVWKENTSYKIRLSPTVQTSTDEFKNDTIEYMKTISNIFIELGIRNKVTYETRYGLNLIYITFDQALENLYAYSNIIGYRYCAEKTRKSTPVIEYLRYKQYVISKKRLEYNNIVELYKLHNTPQQIIRKTGYADYIVKRVIEGYNKNSIPEPKCTNIIGYDIYIQKYYLTNDKMLSQISDIRNVDNEPVYDFTTISPNHSFVANGVVVHNCVETPEHAKVGLVKHLTLLGSVTVPTQSQSHIIRKLLDKRVTKLENVHPTQISYDTRVFLNGDLCGVVSKPVALFAELKTAKFNNTIESTCGIVFDDITNEIRIYCDGGRLYRPVIRVVDNMPLITKEHIDIVSPNKVNSSTMITSWEEFMNRFPGVVEYIDVDEQAYSLISPTVDGVYLMHERMIKSAELSKTYQQSLVVNRYGDMMFYNYTHSEFHPSLLLGLIATNIPFSNHNQGPRNIFQYAQGRQAMCIYASNYRFRMDTSYILYHPQKPLVNTRTGKYMYNDILSPGENAVVAIMCYTGQNQEDAVIANKSAIDRGLFRSTSFEKYMSVLQKNKSTSQDEIFMKPDLTKVAGKRNGSYEKLNDRGFIPEETTIAHGDILIGKVSPIQPTENSNKIYKDNSEIYKQHVLGVVDKVFSDIYNPDDYEMKKVRTRSERVPNVGDKLCCYEENHEILTTDGWIKIKDVTRAHHVACLIDGKKLEYHNPTEIQSYDYVGNMYVLKSNQVQLMVTPNHRMYIGNRTHDKYKVLQAQDIYHKRLCYMKNVDEFIPDMTNCPPELEVVNGIVKQFVVNNVKLPINEWLTVFGIWIAEGSCTNRWVVNFAANKKRVQTALSECCKKMNLQITKRSGHYDEDPNELSARTICNKSIAPYLEKLSVGAINKFLPNWVWYLNREQCRVLINGMMLGDGHTMKNGTRRYDTSSYTLANDFQRLCLHAGWSTNMLIKYPPGHVSICKKSGREGEVFKSTTNSYRLTIIETQNRPIVNKNITLRGENACDSYIPFNGKVYCCTVPNDGIIYIRRNGIPVWCGNSRHG